MLRKTMIALAATAAIAGATATSASAGKKIDVDIYFGGFGYGFDGDYDDYDCGTKWIKKVKWVKTPWGYKKKKVWKKVYTCW